MVMKDLILVARVLARDDDSMTGMLCCSAFVFFSSVSFSSFSNIFP